MSKSSRPAQSGLRIIKHVWSIRSATQEPKSSRSIYLPLTSPSSQSTYLPPTPPNPVSKKLTGSEQRLKDVQDALAGYAPVPPSRFTVIPTLVESKAQNKYWRSNNTSPNPRTHQLVGATNRKNTYQNSTSSSSDRKKFALSQEQRQILKLVWDGNSVFYTGSAGTGKSVLLREIIETLRKKHTTIDSVAVTASTGIAACNIDGITLHSFAAIGLGTEPADYLANAIAKNRTAVSRWARTKVLIIDEVSMIDGDLFDKLSQIACIIRRRPEPFGGIQVVVTGDFFQLPPVAEDSKEVKFAFEAQLWKQTFKHTYNLTKVFRQCDKKFVDMLNETRFGALSYKSVQNFKKLSRSIEYEDGLLPTELFPRRDDVERSNMERLNRLATEEEVFHSVDDGDAITDIARREKVLAKFMAPRRLTLRVGAQVMLIKNFGDGLVNGSMGKVLHFIDPEPAAHGIRYPVVEFLSNGIKTQMTVRHVTWTTEIAESPSGRKKKEKKIQVSRTQIPLILAWALSIHKSQGQTLQRVKVDLGRVFEKGQVYVALSRATTLKGLQVLNFNAIKVQAYPKVIEWHKTLSTISDS